MASEARLEDAGQIGVGKAQIEGLVDRLENASLVQIRTDQKGETLRMPLERVLLDAVLGRDSFGDATGLHDGGVCNLVGRRPRRTESRVQVDHRLGVLPAVDLQGKREAVVESAAADRRDKPCRLVLVRPEIRFLPGREVFQLLVVPPDIPIPAALPRCCGPHAREWPVGVPPGTRSGPR
ncbi:hypothetical protein ACU686_20840 [Yinghuangia aomiensis]